MKLPIKIDPCPIVEAVVEIRFSTEIDNDAVFGVLYPNLRTDFPLVEKLPILQLPEIVRAQDHNLKYQPYYSMKNTDYVIQVGPSVVTISNLQAYPGWAAFSGQILALWKKIESATIAERILRLGIRYINYFNENIFENARLQIIMAEEKFNSDNMYFRTEISGSKFSHSLQVANRAELGDKKTKKVSVGSIIDIDTHASDLPDDFFEHAEDLLNEGHLEEKALFFRLLKPDFLSKLNPQY